MAQNVVNMPLVGYAREDLAFEVALLDWRRISFSETRPKRFEEETTSLSNSSPAQFHTTSSDGNDFPTSAKDTILLVGTLNVSHAAPSVPIKLQGEIWKQASSRSDSPTYGKPVDIHSGYILRILRLRINPVLFPTLEHGTSSPSAD